MDTIYRSITPRTHWHPPQHIDATLIADVDGGHRVRVRVHFDTSYPGQCNGSLAVLSGGDFKQLLPLGSHEIPFVADYHALDPAVCGEMLRNGDRFELSLRSALEALAALAGRILNH